MMNCRQLLYIKKIAEQGSFSKSAAEMNKSVSTISRALKAVETELQAELFLRQGGYLKPTIYGKVFLENAEIIQNDLSALSYPQKASAYNWSENEIQYLMAMRRFKNMTRASESLFVTQSALSLVLKEINRNLGIVIFRRIRGGLEETAEGSILLNQMEKIRDDFTLLHQELEEINELMYSQIRLGVPLNLGAYLLPRIIPAFHQQFPSIRFVINECNSQELDRLLMEEKVDLCVSHHHGSNEKIHYEDFMEDPFVLVVPQNLIRLFEQRVFEGIPHALYQEEMHALTAESLCKLADIPFIMVTEGQKLRKVVDLILAQAGAKTDIYCTSKSMETVKRLVMAGVGISILPRSYLNLYSDTSGLYCYPLDPALKGTWTLTTAIPADRSMFRSTREFMSVLSRALQSLEPVQ